MSVTNECDELTVERVREERMGVMTLTTRITQQNAPEKSSCKKCGGEPETHRVAATPVVTPALSGFGTRSEPRSCAQEQSPSAVNFYEELSPCAEIVTEPTLRGRCSCSLGGCGGVPGWSPLRGAEPGHGESPSP